MKAIKVILAIAVVAVIGFFVWKFLGPTLPPVSEFEKSKNPWVKDIKHEIDSIVSTQINFVNADKCYANIQAHIDDNYQNKRLSEVAGDQTSNETNKRLLYEALYASYFKKFVELTYKVFNGSEWKPNDLSFIGKETEKLKKSPHFDGKDYQGNVVNEINTVLSKYREIAGFIAASNNFSYSYYGLLDRFPDVSDKVQKSRTYLANNLDNSYVNNCTRLKDGLRQIPQRLFNRHVGYLRTKIQQNGGKYTEYNYQSDYNNTVYTPLRNQIDALDNDIYSVGYDVFDSGYNGLDNLLSGYNRLATDYFRNLNNR